MGNKDDLEVRNSSIDSMSSKPHNPSNNMLIITDDEVEGMMVGREKEKLTNL